MWHLSRKNKWNGANLSLLFFSLSLPSNDSQSWECRLREQIVIDFYRVFIERCHVLKVRFNFVIARLLFLSIAFHFFSRRKNGWFPFFRKGNRESLEKLGIKLVVKFERSKSTEHKFENTFGRSKRVSRRLYHFAFSFFFFYGFYACRPLQSTLNTYNFGWSATTDKFHLASNNSHETKPVPCPAPCLLPFIFPPLVVGSSAPVRYLLRYRLCSSFLLISLVPLVQFPFTEWKINLIIPSRWLLIFNRDGYGRVTRCGQIRTFDIGRFVPLSFAKTRSEHRLPNIR